MTENTQTKPTVEQLTDAWKQALKIWTEDGDPSEALAKDVMTMAAEIRLLRSVVDPTFRAYGEAVASFITTMVASCITKTMHDTMTSLDKREDVDVTTKAEISAYLLSLVTLITASTDGASRVVAGTDPRSPESFAITIRDILRKQKAEREAAAAAKEGADGGQ